MARHAASRPKAAATGSLPTVTAAPPLSEAAPTAEALPRPERHRSLLPLFAAVGVIVVLLALTGGAFAFTNGFGLLAQATDTAPAATPSSQVDVAMNVGEVSGGQATGLAVERLEGEVTVHQSGDTFSVQLGNVGSGAQLAVGKGIQQSQEASKDPVDVEADHVAAAIEANGLEKCLLVARHAKHDGMVSGRDDERKLKHESLGYIFGNNAAFVRILRDAETRERSVSDGSPVDKIARMKQREAS